MNASHTLVIIGGGFTGSVTAINLLRAPPACAARIVLVDRGPEVGRGVAYARHPYPYPLNVPAARMSALADQPDDFLNFARRHDAAAGADDFLSRELYGSYVQATLNEAVAAAPPHIRFEVLIDSVVALRKAQSGAAFDVELARSAPIAADTVVLATGNPPARTLAGVAAADLPGPAPREPWQQLAPSPGAGALFIVGTGLTMVDIVAAALQRDPTRQVHALSRHGLLPCAQYIGHSVAGSDENLAAVLTHARSVRELMAAVRAAAARAEAAGGHWQDVVMQVRQRVPGVWAALPMAERARFLRHVRPYWDVHRHRMPGAVAAELARYVQSGRLTVHAGRLQWIRSHATGAEVGWVARGTRQVETLRVGDVVTCTGPDHDLARSTDPLWRCLRDTHLVTPDPHGQGLLTGPALEVVGRDGKPTAGLYYAGPMLRANYWEATAVAELRGHAARLAAHLVSTLSSASA